MIKYDPSDIIGKIFGDLKVIKITDPPINVKPRITTYYYCECNCGTVNCYKYSISRRDQLLTGNTKSCKANKKALTSLSDVIKSSFNAIYSKGRYNDSNLTLDQFIKLASDNCFYCGINLLKNLTISLKIKEQNFP